MENVHPSIIANIEQSEKDGGVWLRHLKDGDLLKVKTRNTLYDIAKIAGQLEIRGNAKYCPEFTKAHINGSTWGGSMIKVGFIGLGMHLEFTTEQHPSPIITTPIESIEFYDISVR